MSRSVRDPSSRRDGKACEAAAGCIDPLLVSYRQWARSGQSGELSRVWAGMTTPRAAELGLTDLGTLRSRLSARGLLCTPVGLGLLPLSVSSSPSGATELVLAGSNCRVLRIVDASRALAPGSVHLCSVDHMGATSGNLTSDPALLLKLRDIRRHFMIGANAHGHGCMDSAKVGSGIAVLQIRFLDPSLLELLTQAAFGQREG